MSSMTTVMICRLLANKLMKRNLCRSLHYVQGQSPKEGVREYFYFIDHQGQLFLDDSKMKNFTSCFKEKAFLAFFFTRLRMNETGQYQEEFPYFSPCGRERNYIRCDDTPVVYTHILPTKAFDGSDRISYGGAAEMLTVKFEPENICMLPSSGRIYHPASSDIGGVGLIKSSLAIELSRDFRFEDGETRPPTHFTWKGVEYTLTNELFKLMDINDD